MNKQTLFAACLLTTLAGCATKAENPIDYVTFRNEPLVKQVEDGMSKELVLKIGGPPSVAMVRTVKTGSCHNYVLNHDGNEQPYHVSFDSADRVDGKGFMTCEQMELNERAAATP